MTAAVNDWGVTQVTSLTGANPRGLQGNVSSKALLVPGSALILGLNCHAIPPLAWCSQLPVTVPPPSKYTMAIAWLAPGSNGLLLMSRTNRSHCLFFICQRFNYMDSAPIKAASLKLHPHSWAFFPLCVFSAVFISIESKQREEREREQALLSRGNSLPLYPDGLSVI